MDTWPLLSVTQRAGLELMAVAVVGPGDAPIAVAEPPDELVLPRERSTAASPTAADERFSAVSVRVTGCPIARVPEGAIVEAIE
jgi:hypothetical protein